MIENAIDIKDITESLPERDRLFVLNTVKYPQNSATENAKLAGAPEASAGQRANEMKKKPEVQKAIDELKEKVGSVDDIDVKDFVKTTLFNEAVNADNSRDKREAAHLLGKTEGMFRDVVEKKDNEDTSSLLDRIEKQLGKEARDKAAVGLGMDDG